MFLNEENLIKNYIVVSNVEAQNNNNNLLAIFGNNSFDTFDQMKELCSKHPILSVASNIISYQDIYCSCFTFLKQKKCCHVAKYLVDNKLTELVNITLLKAKMKRGRKRKITRNSSLNKE